jgi:hypothetical protein
MYMDNSHYPMNHKSNGSDKEDIELVNDMKEERNK